MSAGISFDEMLAWNDEASQWWKTHLDANPNLLELPCGIGGAATVQEFVRHIWGAELRWAGRLAKMPETPREKIPAGPLDALFDLHTQAMVVYRRLLTEPEQAWSEPYILTFDWVPPDQRRVTRRKIAGHALFHGQRHWAQLATLVRNAGFPSNFRGDLLFSPALG
ncbi:MAG TPA: DinB family protein [Terracidiphilus sp.]|nr:DinB family protein [Terracidiphilus sp.]